jgi:hypothetical protein
LLSYDKKYTLSLFLLLLTASLFGLAISAVNAQSDPAAKIPAGLQSQLDGLAPGETIAVIVKLADQAVSRIPDLVNLPEKPQAVVEALQAQAHISQQGITALLEAGQTWNGEQVALFWAFYRFGRHRRCNQQLAARDDVEISFRK